MQDTSRPWSDLSSAEKLAARWARILDPGFPFVDQEAKEEYAARVTRLRKAMLLEGTPDRVPVCVLGHYYPGLRSGLTPYEATRDYQRAADAWAQCNRELQCDEQIGGTATAIPGRAFDILDYRLFKWPGHGIPKESGFQYNESEWMKPEDYDRLIDDPTDYLYHVYLPRVAGALEGLSFLASPLDMTEMAYAPLYLTRWARPEVRETLDKLIAAGEECTTWAGIHIASIGQLLAEGIPALLAGATAAPFDFLGDTLRSTRAIVTDMYRRPEKVMEACDRLAHIMIRWVTDRTNPESAPVVIIPLHKGAEGFMSDQQFRDFYWPSLRKLLVGLVDEGFTPYLFAEGAYGDRLDVIRDLPPGKVVWQFDQTDMRRAKETLGGVCCVRGNVPLSLLQLGSPEEVTEYCEDLIDTVAPGGGFILDAGAAIDEAKDENVRAMVETGKRYGRYA